jgi:tRNA U34 2-thiouridine synthase MnmA/TrmU
MLNMKKELQTDVLCNREIKFEFFMKKIALSLGADFVALQDIIARKPKSKDGLDLSINSRCRY